MNPSKSIGIWIRVSTEDQAQGESPEVHEKRARYYAESKEWRVSEVYRLEAVSGKSVIDHPEAQRMLTDIKSGHITGLIFSKLARLARNTRELLDFADIFREYKADLISLQESIDTSSPAGRLFYTMIAAMAQWEREEIASRVAASVPIRAKMGKPLGGQASFGYDWKDGKLVVNPLEAPIRKLMHELFLEHKRKKTVAKLLNEQGYRTRNGSKFSDTTIMRLLQDPTAKGQRIANYSKSTGENKKWEYKPESEWVYQACEAIVSEELWNKCNQILNEQNNKHKKPARKPVHLFTGFAYCDCGTKMYIPSSSKSYICAECKIKINMADLEELYHDQLEQFFFSSDEIQGYLNKAQHLISEKETLLTNLEKERQKISSEMSKTHKLYLADQLSVEGFGEIYKPLEERLGQIKNQIPELQGEIDFLKIQHQSSNQIISDTQDLYAGWSNFSHEEKRKLVEQITEKIIIGQEDIVINISYLPPTHTPSLNSAERQHNHTGVLLNLLPFSCVALRVSKPKHKSYPINPLTIGEHLKKKRLDQKMSQSCVAKLIGCTEASLCNWETNKSQPIITFYPTIIKFLGYVPFETKAMTIGEKIKLYRQLTGQSLRNLEKLTGHDQATISGWENGKGKPCEKFVGKIERYLK